MDIAVFGAESGMSEHCVKGGLNMMLRRKIQILKE